MSMKEAYEQKLQAQLDKWNAEIERLKAKADDAQADAQMEYLKQVEELRAMQESVYQQMTELRNASNESWKDIKTGIDSAWNALDQSIKAAASRFK